LFWAVIEFFLVFTFFLIFFTLVVDVDASLNSGLSSLSLLSFSSSLMVCFSFSIAFLIFSMVERLAAGWKII